jgi:hypothetical protein
VPTLEEFTAQVQRWHPVKLSVVWAGYLAFSLWARNESAHGGVVYDIGYNFWGSRSAGEYLPLILWAAVTVPMVWITWQWASAREPRK